MGRRKQDGTATTTGRGVLVRTHASGRTTLFIHFSYLGMTQREPLHLDDSPKNRRYAEGLRAEIVNAIARQTFRYEDYFPNSRIVTRGGPAGAGATIRSKLEAYKEACALAVKRGNMSAATLASYRKVVDGKLIPRWGDTKLRDLTTADLREWLMLQEGTRKTFNNMLIPLRPILDYATTDEIIDFSPLAKLPLDRILDKIGRRVDLPGQSVLGC